MLPISANYWSVTQLGEWLMAFQRDLEGFNYKHHTVTCSVLASPLLACTAQHIFKFVFKMSIGLNLFLLNPVQFISVLLAAGPSKLLEWTGPPPPERSDPGEFGTLFMWGRGFGLNKYMIKQMSHRAKSLSAPLLGPYPCVSNKVTFEREQKRRSSRWREVLGVS